MRMGMVTVAVRAAHQREDDHEGDAVPREREVDGHAPALLLHDLVPQ